MLQLDLDEKKWIINFLTKKINDSKITYNKLKNSYYTRIIKNKRINISKNNY